MKILLNDIIQFASGVPDKVKSPALSDSYTAAIEFDAVFLTSQTINCVGIGYTDATELIVDNGTTTRTITISKAAPYQNGLYPISEISGTDFNISHDGTFIGRVGIGTYRELGISVTMEPGFYTTTESRITLSGNVIPGKGGFSGRRQGANVKYRIDSDAYDDIETAYPGQISKSYPFFLNFEKELHKLSQNMLYFYGGIDEPISLLQSSIYRYLYSYRFDFKERF